MTEVKDEKKSDVVDPIDADIEAAVDPFANSGGEMKVESASAPAGLFGHKWHPTQGVITIDGKKYDWNARAHRKLRHLWAEQAEEHPAKFLSRVRLVSWEPHIVTWYMIWIGVVANTLWVVNGLYVTWPEQAKRESAEMISYVTGVIGAFLFIVTGYLGYIEAINQTYAAVRSPTDSDAAVRYGPRENFKCADPIYGEYPSPIGHGKHGKYSEGTSSSQKEEVRLLELGYPLVQDVSTKHLITAGLLKQYTKQHSPEETEKAVVGRDFDIRVGEHVIRVCAKSFATAGEEQCPEDKKNVVLSLSAPIPRGYCWWTWQPDLSYIGIFNALVFFVSTVRFTTVNHLACFGAVKPTNSLFRILLLLRSFCPTDRLLHSCCGMVANDATRFAYS
jgi:hypothetical protein